MKRLFVLLVAAIALVAGCTSSVFTMSVGDCFNDPDSTTVSSVDDVDCGDPHDNEVYLLFDIPGSVFPGDQSIEDQAAEGCVNGFESYVGRDFQSSELNVSFFTPTSESWDADDREVICFLFDLNLTKLTGSMQGTGR